MTTFEKTKVRIFSFYLLPQRGDSTMAIVTITSDWGTRDHYAAVVKGIILKQLPETVLVDLSLEIPPFNLQHASFVLRNAYHHFPDGSIHLIDVNSHPSKQNKYLLAVDGHQYFIAADNGLFALIFDKPPEKIIELALQPDQAGSPFIARDLFAPVACSLISGTTPEELGTALSGVQQMVLFAPTIEKDVIRGKVIFIDAYENVFLNITRDLFEKVGKGRPFTIYFRSLDYGIQKISTSYSDVYEGDLLAMFSSSGFLEVAMNRGNAASLLGLKPDEMVRIEFRD